jgi:hypothetical protein
LVSWLLLFSKSGRWFLLEKGDATEPTREMDGESRSLCFTPELLTPKTSYTPSFFSFSIFMKQNHKVTSFLMRFPFSFRSWFAEI